MNAVARRSILSPSGAFLVDLLDGLQVRLRQPYMRKAPANCSLERLATAFMNSPGPPMADPPMKGDATMTQGMIEGLLLLGLVGLIWVIVLDMLGNGHHTHDKRQGSVSPEQPDGYEPHNALPGSHRLRSDKST